MALRPRLSPGLRFSTGVPRRCHVRSRYRECQPVPANPAGPSPNNTARRARGPAEGSDVVGATLRLTPGRHVLACLIAFEYGRRHLAYVTVEDRQSDLSVMEAVQAR